MEDIDDDRSAISDCVTEDDFEQFLAASMTRPVFLYKHSTACGVSAWAWVQFSRFAEENMQAEYRRVLVRENHTLSLSIADKSGVRHESPQVILFQNGKAVASLSHRAITKAALESLRRHAFNQRLR